MTLVDASALVAILQAEQEALEFIEFLETHDVLIPASAMVETEILAIRRGLGSDLERLIAKLNAQVTALDQAMVPLAPEAFRRYGKGRHKAALNFGRLPRLRNSKALRSAVALQGPGFYTHGPEIGAVRTPLARSYSNR